MISMKRYIISKAVREPGTVSGRIGNTDERCLMRPTGYWTSNGRRITSYERVDKEIEYAADGSPVYRQYSMDRNHRFWVETEDDA